MTSPQHDDVVQQLLGTIAAQGQRVKQKEQGAQEALLQQARALVAALEDPAENILFSMMAEPGRLFAEQMALDLRLLDTLAAEGGRPKSLAELVAPSDASPKLVTRILRHMAATKMIDQIAEDEYAANRNTRELDLAKFRGCTRYVHAAILPTLAKMPEYLSHTKYQNPENTNDGPFQHAFQTPSQWGWLNANPEVLTALQDFLAGVRDDRPDFMDRGFYPVEERLIQGLRLDGAASAFVDVGGGDGRALAELHAKVPAWSGQLILQDQASVVQVAKTRPHAALIEATVHDFFTPQPIRGARAYYLRWVLHDWQDDECRTILGHLKDAMEPGYSRILIHENVVADVNAAWQHTALDLYMMALCATRERTEREWRELLSSVGLKIAGIWTKGEGNLSVIEAML